MNVKLQFKTRGSILRESLVVLGAACAIGGCSIRSHGTGLTPSSTVCYPPTSVQARANPAGHTDTYVMKGQCLENEVSQGAPGSPATAQSTYASYTVTGLWACNTYSATETYVYSQLKGLNMSNYHPVKAQEVSSCRTDPWINSVRCTPGALRWLEPGEAGMVSIKGPFPITAGHINVISAISQLLASVSPPTITVPTENENILIHTAEAEITVVVRAALPCGLGSGTQAVLEAHSRAGAYLQATGHIVHGSATVKLPLQKPGMWRVRAFVLTANSVSGAKGPWRDYRITKGEVRMETPHLMVIPRHFALPAGAAHKQ